MTPTEGAARVRVAMLIQSYYPQVGGAERQLMALAPVLQSQGVAVDVVTRRHPGLAPCETIAGVAVHRPAAPGTKAIRSVAFTVGAARRIARLRPDLIHTHDLFSPTTAALLAKRRLGTPVVAKVPRGGHRGNIERLMGRSLGRRRLAWLCREVDMFIAISHEIDRELEAIGVPPERRVAIPNGVDTVHFAPPPEHEKKNRRAALDLPQAPIVIFTGRLAPEKRIQDLVAVWPAVRARHEGALLLLVGAGDQRAALESQNVEGVRFAGSVLDVAPYLQAADLFVLPSATEGLSNSLLEAMSAGLPCIATAVGGAPELIDHGRSGWLVPPGEPELLRQAILILLGDAGLRESIGLEARRHVESGHSLPRIADAMRNMYRRVLARGAPGAGAITGDPRIGH